MAARVASRTFGNVCARSESWVQTARAPSSRYSIPSGLVRATTTEDAMGLSSSERCAVLAHLTRYGTKLVPDASSVRLTREPRRAWGPFVEPGSARMYQ